ncbi:MAG: LysR substrate-binding domain-containing protein [Lachnospiraceae bacterium]|nr:LysR substrate-binding domain-containing protein [Lachnospiraceae bacterium]
MGIAILPASMQQYSSRLKACSIADADLTTEIQLAWRKGKQPPEIQDFFSSTRTDKSFTCNN